MGRFHEAKRTDIGDQLLKQVLRTLSFINMHRELSSTMAAFWRRRVAGTCGWRISASGKGCRRVRLGMRWRREGGDVRRAGLVDGSGGKRLTGGCGRCLSLGSGGWPGPGQGRAGRARNKSTLSQPGTGNWRCAEAAGPGPVCQSPRLTAALSTHLSDSFGALQHYG